MEDKICKLNLLSMKFRFQSISLQFALIGLDMRNNLVIRNLGQLLRTSLELIDDCMPTKSSNMALAVQLAHVNVQLKNRKRNKQEEITTQAGSANDLWQMTEKSGNDMGSILSNIALRDDHSGYYTSLKGQTLTKAGGYNRQSSGYFMDGHLTPLGEYFYRFFNVG